MESTSAIHTFLDSVSRRLRRRAAWTGAIYLITGLATIALVGPLIAYWAELDSQTTWIWLGLALGTVVASWLVGVSIPRRRWRERRASASYVGSQVETIASDLLSSVELIDDELQGDGSAPGSADLRGALFANTAERIEPLRLRALVPYSPVARALKAAAAVSAVYLLVAIFAPVALAQGWNRLLSEAPRAAFGGAILVDEPIVGDVDILVEFPLYTRKPSLRLPASSGDFEAMPGSTVSFSTRALGPVQDARILLFGEQGLERDEADEEIEFSIQGSTLRASIEVVNETHYRFEVHNGESRSVEARAHKIGIRADKTPTVQLYAPADELDVAKVKRIELAYVAEDDFGIAKVELVYKAKGGKEFRQPLEVEKFVGDDPTAMRPTNDQGKYLWDLATLPLRPGVQIEYHVEVTDNDNVLGPNIGKSKSFKLRLYSPRERHEDLITRQRQLAEHMLELLAERLVSTESSVAEHRRIHRIAEEIVVEMGSLVASLKEDELATPKLTAALVALRKNMSNRTLAEAALLEDLEKRRAPPSQELPNKRLQDSDIQIIAGLEDDVLTLSDWLHRQEMENLLGISDEIKASQDRLEKLFAEYERTGDPELLAEIERELKALEKRLQEMAAKRTSMPEDVLDRFVNADAMQQQQDASCLAKVREFLALGDAKAAQEQMAKCSEEMDEGAKALEEALQGLRSDSFSEEEKAFNEMMSDLADLSQDQQDIADKADEIYKQYAQEVSKLQDGRASEAQKSATETLKKLRKKLAKIPKKGMTPFAKEELEILGKRLDDAEAMLKKGDLAEALSMARHANQSLETVQDELQIELDEDWSREAVVAEKAARSAQPLARKLVQELRDATPSPAEIMSKGDKRNLEKLRRQQKSAEGRAQKLLKRAEAQADKLPGKAGQAIGEGLKGSAERMGQAGEQMRAKDPSSAREMAQQAADLLKKAQEGARSAARQKQNLGGSTWRDEPVRIPGAEDYKAPEKFRKEIMDAMKDDSAPSGFSDQVKRYYKDIIQ